MVVDFGAIPSMMFDLTRSQCNCGMLWYNRYGTYTVVLLYLEGIVWLILSNRDASCTMMLTVSAAARRKAMDLVRSQAARSLSTKAARTHDGPIGSDGRHEIWREGIYDHDNEPK